VKGRSVALSRRTAYWSGVKSFRHSASLCVTLKASAACVATGHGWLLAPAATAIVPLMRRNRRVIMMQSPSKVRARVECYPQLRCRPNAG
jgi:hypothetical protein